jgi:hypothetical protein
LLFFLFFISIFGAATAGAGGGTGDLVVLAGKSQSGCCSVDLGFLFPSFVLFGLPAISIVVENCCDNVVEV